MEYMGAMENYDTSGERMKSERQQTAYKGLVETEELLRESGKDDLIPLILTLKEAI